MSKKRDYLAALSAEEKQALTAALHTWRDAGEKNPMIPIGEDIDEDGIADSWGLTPKGILTVRSGVSLDATVYQSTGEGVEGGEPK